MMALINSVLYFAMWTVFGVIVFRYLRHNKEIPRSVLTLWAVTVMWCISALMLRR